MAFEPGLNRGDSLTSNELRQVFRCGIQGGMRRSRSTNSLVLISDPTRGVYEDRWERDVLWYTGMGLHGNQDLMHAQNRTLLESDTNRVQLFLFEVFEPRRYFYQGRVRLAAYPRREKQTDSQGQFRDVWVFPLRLAEEDQVFRTPQRVFTQMQESQARKASRLPQSDLLQRTKTARGKPGRRYVTSVQYDRDPNVAELAKRRADGICQLCDQSAPFRNREGEPFLETHHVQWLARDGEDTIVRTLCLSVLTATGECMCWT